jgi:hypothetical protein
MGLAWRVAAQRVAVDQHLLSIEGQAPDPARGPNFFRDPKFGRRHSRREHTAPEDYRGS